MKRWWALPCCAALLLTACGTTVKQTPESPPDAETLALRGRVEHEGNPAHLPRALRDVSAAGHPIYRYDTSVVYEDTSDLQLFNPLLLFGLPFLGFDVLASGRMEVIEGGEPVRRYEQECTIRLRRSVWTFPSVTRSDLRRKALYCVARRIDAEIEEDRAELERIGAAAG